jgi:hypothetical protein
MGAAIKERKSGIVQPEGSCSKTFPEITHFFRIALRINYMSGQSGQFNGKGSGNMRKFICVTVVMMMLAAMLSSGALAENGKEHKGGIGAGKEQKQSQAAGNEDKGNSHGPEHTPAVHNLDKSPADDKVITGDDDNGDENEVAGDDNGDENEVAGDDDDDADETSGHVKKNNNKPDEKPQEGPNHGNAYGRVRNIQAVLDDIGQLAGEESAVQLNTLLSTYREAKDTETARTALTALLDALTQACTVAATDVNTEGTDAQDTLALANLAKLREKVLANAGNDNGTLLALMHAYEDALRIMNHLEPIDDLDEETETDGDTGSDVVPIT